MAGEFDVVVANYNNKTAYVYEVKNSSEIVENQAKNLLSEDFCMQFEKEIGVPITYKAVIYNGNTCDAYGVHYLNAEEFLTLRIERATPSIQNSEKTNSSSIDDYDDI